MLFKRRAPQTLLRKASAAVWPTSGWRRGWRYIFYRIGRLPGTGYAIAGGFAWGAAMSFTPFIGLHIVLSALGAWLTRCSVVASVIGTVVGNPWTFPFIWIWLYKVGTFMGFGGRGIDAESMDFSEFFGGITTALLGGDWTFMAETALPVLIPMMAGAIPSAAIVWVIFFLLLKPTIERYKSAVAVRRMRRLASDIDGMQRSQEVT